MKRWHTIGNKVFDPDGELHMTCDFSGRKFAKGLAQVLNEDMDNGRKQKCLSVSAPRIEGMTFHSEMVSYLEG